MKTKQRLSKLFMAIALTGAASYTLAADNINVNAICPGPVLSPMLQRTATPEAVRAADDHLALEEVQGAEALAFVERQNARSRAVLEGEQQPLGQ